MNNLKVLLRSRLPITRRSIFSRLAARTICLPTESVPPNNEAFALTPVAFTCATSRDNAVSASRFSIGSASNNGVGGGRTWKIKRSASLTLVIWIAQRKAQPEELLRDVGNAIRLSGPANGVFDIRGTASCLSDNVAMSSLYPEGEMATNKNSDSAG
jgi:hypothetical protein